MRRTVVGLVAVAMLLSIAPPAQPTPVATSEEQYLAYGRVFPDPHGCGVGEPGKSPFAKGQVCAVDFIQFQENIAGLRFLEDMFPRFVKVYTLHRHFDCAGNPTSEPKEACKDFKSAGLAVTASEDGAVTRERLPLHMVRITDEKAPNKGKEYFVFPLAIHGIERAGVEGGTRAAEDLATWGACEAKTAPDVVDCESDQNKVPHPLLEATPKRSITAGEALRKSVVYFIYPNPDGWNRGDRTTGTQFYQRYNGNGVDLNRDWPEQGFTFRPYTPWSEPETRAFGRVLQAIGPKDARGKPKWTGGIDLHGQLIDRAFSFTLIGGSERPYDKNQRVLQTVKGAWADAEKRLAWSPIIKPNNAPQDDPRIYGVQWGTVWDTIDYTVTGALGNWIDSPVGLNADGIDNEMSLSHLINCGIGSCFDQNAEQLHVDGNKSLIYSMINYSLKPENQTFRTGGRVAYVHNRGVAKAKSDRLSTPPKFTKLPPQDDIADVVLSPANDYTHEFKVEGPRQGFYNGGIAVTITCANAQGVSPCAFSEALLERFDPRANKGEGEWEVVNSYFNQSAIYVQAGQALHANLPTPGRWRVRISRGDTTGVFTTDIDFTKEKGWPDPGQIGYRVTNMNFWRDLAPFARPGLTKITAAEIASRQGWRKFDTIVVTDKTYPEIAGRLRSWVRGGGNLVLLDRAMHMLKPMGIVKSGISGNVFYAGYVNFSTQKREVTYSDPLARKINQPGAAEGQQGGEQHRRQTYEPVPLGIALQNPNGGDANNSPVWYVSNSAWEKAKGRPRAVGTTGNTTNVSFGEIKLGRGRVRILGALLPMPTDRFDHPFGLANYALTYSGYQLLNNVLTWNR
ncbi:MAG: M14 family zinc carboxypeptidase [Actinomycetota bacterium]